METVPKAPDRLTENGAERGATSKSGQEEALTALRVLVVEDDPDDVELELHTLRKAGFETYAELAKTPEEFKQKLSKTSYDIVLADYRLSGWNGMETVEMLRLEGLDIPVILVSGALGELNAVECIKQGAADYVLKDHLLRLPECVRRAIREKKLREENRQTHAELTRSNRDLEQFAYVASHDLQEPLRMVATYTQLLEERFKGKLDESAEKYINYAVEGALRMQALVQDLLTFSRVGRGGIELKPVEVDSLLRIVTKNLQASIEESGAQVHYEGLPTVVGDWTLLQQLFQNLIGNAIKFRGLEAPLIRIVAETNGAEWIFSVRDNGIGIASEHSEIVFEIFKRLHTHAEYPGSGIGLSICKKIVEQHGGRIWVESKPGEGCNFQFKLPAGKKRGSYDHTAEKRG